MFDQGENAALLGVLERLAQSAEALRDAETVSERVWDLLEKAAEDTELRERLATVAGDFPQPVETQAPTLSAHWK